ncbi:MAG: hypothetical protein AVDCRST_MAG33-437 [uncultured Thermomicrobiales bacterium]|uniref:HTH cro/C1-type domain-containing protein n=1 Tax=uncultured Thermomicrobiales bacterium TaxID=1645740 RepID=A0A6J4UBM0_9BACT|nr:MAG: hypothetical protein AVDCRST_MAG33-437 [uncultured Thermomicrobiales bacterium]
MTDDFDVSALGQRIRSIRLTAGLSVDALAREAGVSRSMVAAVEGGEKAPTVLTLHRIANGLGTNMTRLLGEETRGDVIVLRQRDQRVARDPSGWERRNLTPVLPDSAFEFMRTTIPAGVDTGVFPPHRPGTREVVAVESGTLRLTIDGTPWHLASGDSISYRGDVLHQFANPGEVDCVYYLALHQGEPARRTDPQETDRRESAETFAGDEDPLWYQAVEAVRSQQWITARFLETRFAIDAMRASRLLHAMERERLVTPGDIPTHLIP